MPHAPTPDEDLGATLGSLVTANTVIAPPRLNTVSDRTGAAPGGLPPRSRRELRPTPV